MSPTNNEKAFSPDAKQALSDILRRISFRAEVFYRGQLCDSWALDTSGTGNVNFHIVCQGECWLHLPGDKVPVRLRDGDIVVFRMMPHILLVHQTHLPVLLAYKILAEKCHWLERILVLL